MSTSPARCTSAQRRDNPVLMAMAALAGLIFLVSAITCFVYLLDCLYAERKDRSILFWKSLPVSDADTVLVKFAVGMVIVPLAVFILTMIAYGLIYGALSLGVPAFAIVHCGRHASHLVGRMAQDAGHAVRRRCSGMRRWGPGSCWPRWLPAARPS